LNSCLWYSFSYLFYLKESTVTWFPSVPRDNEDFMDLCMSQLICSNLWRFDESMYVPPNMFKSMQIWWIYGCPTWYVQIYEDFMDLCMSHLICSNLWRFDGSMYVPPNMSKSMKIWWSMDFSPNMFKSMKIWWIYGCPTWYVQIYEDIMDLWQICPSLCSNLWKFDGSMDVPPNMFKSMKVWWIYGCPT